MTPKHVPPSRRRFELSHPTVTTRVDRELHLALVDLAEAYAKTLAEVARDALAAYVESDDSGGQEDEQELAHAPEDHPEHLELKAEVERLGSQRWQLQLDLDYARGQLRDLARLKDKAEKAEATLAQIGGPLGMYVRCIHCSHEWHEHQWKGLNRSWLCPRE